MNKNLIICVLLVIFLILFFIIKNKYFILKNNIEKTNTIYIGSEGKGSYGKNFFEYLVKIIYPNTNIIWENSNKANLIVASNFYHEEIKWNTNKKPYIYWSGESFNLNNLNNLNNNIAILSTTNFDHNNKNIYHVPYCCFHFDYTKPQREYNVDLNNRKLLGYCNSNPVSIREQLVSLIAEKDNTNGVYALGKATGSSPKIIKKKLSGGHSTDNVIKEYSNYKFVIAMENKIDNGYITEKIINAFRSGAVPIFWGDAKYAKELFNEKAFICVNDFDNLDDCANYIINLTDNDINKMINEPMFKNNIIPDIFRVGDLVNPPAIYKEISQKIKTNINLFG